ncbi:hypothetical protein PF005_g27062 [Phytophthora fragariae]|uniref:Crinkler (CRN) family protein n=3 Tax=Phytophthora fragariae TaxID=53985 RepID=A0A6A4BLA5_9STRA|nr:hypothetical protein PF003_g20790 [Phytophthora fragariae]KAE9066780.1 hypothetical protein PF007_g28312 [Phytophthora fragariae]KAE9171631.1 hypothetical protein PF005_g27062 [Phytophthora fragariae]KAE9275696.1 hypothetical protein PF001_g26465 [Phytophthora fragariae]
MYTFPASQLRLFLAKKGDAWLPDDDSLNAVLEGRDFSSYLAMRSSWKLAKPSLFGPNVSLGEDVIHVLVVAPEIVSGAEATQDTKLSTLSMMLKQCKKVGGLPQQGDFLKLFDWSDDDCGRAMDIKLIEDIVHFTGPKFYVRKEILCVLENFKNIYQEEFNEDKVVNKQFILMGSPGTGKSCILALICFYIAVHYKRPVVWFRMVNGGIYPAATRLFYEGKYYEWDDDNGKIFESLYDAMKPSGIDPIKCWFCLDGMVQDEVKEKYWVNKYKLLATSGQFSPKSEAMQFTKRCLVPYWKRRDLEDLGLKHLQFQDNDVDARFFVSGGSLRDFIGDDGKDSILAAVASIGRRGDGEMLLTSSGVASEKQIDRIRMHGVQDVNNTEHYVSFSKWSCCVTSKFALNCLTAVMVPKFFLKLIGVAKGMNDDRLEGVAFEGYFHSLLRHRRSIRVQYCEYDNVDRRSIQDWKNIKEVGSIEVNTPSLVKCEGGNKTECLTVMESWAANPFTMDYWIPATSLCETIDAVAKWTLPDGVLRFCFLQLTKASTHKCDEAFLWELAQPFVNKQLPVCYIALLPDDADEDNRLRFRLKPAVITHQKVLDHIPLYVAHFQVTECYEKNVAAST